MRKRFFLVGLMTAAAAAAGEHSRTLDLERPADRIKTVAIEAGVGEIEILATKDQTISVRVEVSSDSSSFFGSKRSTRELDEVELVAEERGGTLTLRIKPDRRNKEWGEEWSVSLPETVAREVELGVGDVRILDAAADVSVEVGVGEVRIEGLHAAFGSISAECGVGDVSLRTPEGREDGSGFISRDLHARGPGSSTIEAEAGVGDIVIRLR